MNNGTPTTAIPILRRIDRGREVTTTYSVSLSHAHAVLRKRGEATGRICVGRSVCVDLDSFEAFAKCGGA